MLKHERAAAQTAIILALQASRPGDRPSQRDIARVIGCDPSDVSRFKDGERTIDVDELDLAAEEWGVDAAYGPLLARHGARVVVEPVEVPRPRELPRAAAHLARLAAEHTDFVHEMLADGLITEDEANAHNARVTVLLSDSRRLCLRRVRPGRVA